MTEMVLEPALLDEVTLPSARGGKREGEPLEFEIVRALTEADLPALRDSSPCGAGVPDLLHVKHAHHQLARLMALGKTGAEISLITGYSSSYLSNIKHSPAFRELIEAYSSDRDEIFVDVLERMKVLGLTTLDELQRRLMEEPKTWTNQALMELSELMLVSGRASPGSTKGSGGGTGAPAVQVNVQFVKSPHEGMVDVTPSAREVSDERASSG